MASARSEKLARKQLIEICQLTYARGYIAATEGNFSIRLSENVILTTPKGTCKARINNEDLVLVDMQGKALGKGQPSTEIKMHLTAYKRRSDICAIVHAHPTAAIACSVAGVSLTDCILPEVICTLGTIPTAPYATPSTDEVPDSIVKLIKRYDAIVLDHHGVLCLGKDIWDAFDKLETVEHYAQIVALANMLGGAKRLAPGQVEKLIGLRSMYGAKSITNLRKLIGPS